MDFNFLDKIIRKLQNKINMIIIQDIKQPDDKVTYVDNKKIVSTDGSLDINFYRLNDLKGKIGFAVLDNINEEYYLYNEKVNKQRKSYKKEVEISSKDFEKEFDITYGVSEENPEVILLLHIKTKKNYEEVEYEIELDKEANINDAIEELDRSTKIDEIKTEYYEQKNKVDDEVDENIDFIIEDDEIEDDDLENDDSDNEYEEIEFLITKEEIDEYIEESNALARCIEQVRECLNEKSEANEMIQTLKDSADRINNMDEDDEQLEEEVFVLLEIMEDYENRIEDISFEIDDKLYSNYSIKLYKNGKEIIRNENEDNYVIQNYYSMATTEKLNTRDVFRKVSKLTKYINQIIKQIKENNDRDER